jgi:hypothetical protein
MGMMERTKDLLEKVEIFAKVASDRVIIGSRLTKMPNRGLMITPLVWFL